MRATVNLRKVLPLVFFFAALTLAEYLDEDYDIVNYKEGQVKEKNFGSSIYTDEDKIAIDTMGATPAAIVWRHLQKTIKASISNAQDEIVNDNHRRAAKNEKLLDEKEVQVRLDEAAMLAQRRFNTLSVSSPMKEYVSSMSTKRALYIRMDLLPLDTPSDPMIVEPLVNALDQNSGELHGNFEIPRTLTKTKGSQHDSLLVDIDENSNYPVVRSASPRRLGDVGITTEGVGDSNHTDFIPVTSTKIMQTLDDPIEDELENMEWSFIMDFLDKGIQMVEKATSYVSKKLTATEDAGAYFDYFADTRSDYPFGCICDTTTVAPATQTDPPEVPPPVACVNFVSTVIGSLPPNCDMETQRNVDASYNS